MKSEFERQEQFARKIDRRMEMKRFEGGGDSIQYAICQKCDLATEATTGRCAWCNANLKPGAKRDAA